MDMSISYDINYTGVAYEADMNHYASHAAHMLQSQLVQSYDELVQSLAMRLGSTDLAQEAVHEIWLSLQDNQRLKPVANPRAYLKRMAYHRAIDKIRRDKQYSEVHWGVDLDDIDISDNGAAVEDTLYRRTLLQRLIHAIERLPRQRRAIFIASRLEELSQKEVAQRYGVSVVKVRAELRKAHAYFEWILHEA